ncbi:MAG: transcriptional repressor [Pseudomonadota bacterium]|nr:transcriptional repressor [Pseudomonadota bacterium]
MPDAYPQHPVPEAVQIEQYLCQVEQHCREAGVRLTPLRREVLALILQANKPVGAYELLANIGTAGRPAAPPTVYRSLDFLIEHGFIHRLASINAYLSCCHPAHRHQSVFLICTECQHTQELPVGSLAAPLRELTVQQGFVVKQTLIELSGLCQRCQGLAPVHEPSSSHDPSCSHV